uniref:PUM-HD domain-containing protein n=1 Tax=Graphocephala atropunctata TaxID=36148 RepID=A0A1B6L0Z9_9HEMI
MKRSLSSEPAVVTKKAKTKTFSKPDISKKISNKKKEGKQKFGKNKFLGNKTEANVVNDNEPEVVVTKTSAETKIKKHHKNIESPKSSKFGKKVGQEKKLALKKKGKHDFVELPSKLLGKDGKPQWNKVKTEKKKLREDRKVRRTGEDQYQMSQKAKNIWENLRKKGQSAEQREALVNDLFMLLKGQIPNLGTSHDLARVIQWMLKLGSPTVRTAICEELCADTKLYLQSKYASFTISRAFRYGSKTDRNLFIESCNGHFLKLFSHTVAIPVVEQMFSMYASAAQRAQIHREMYGEMHALLQPEVTTIADVPDDLRPAILGSTKANLTKLLEKKDILKTTLFQTVLIDFLASCSQQDRLEILEVIQDDILELLNTKEGSRVVLRAIWHGTNKMRKVFVKKLKGRVKEMAMSERGHLFLLALFDCVDDTVLVKKALIPELLEEVEEIVKDDWGRKVILYLVAHRDSSYFHPQQMEILSKGDTISTKKKDATVREQEMLEAVSDPLLQKIADNPAIWLGDSSVSMVTLAIMKSGKGSLLHQVFKEVVVYMLNPASTVEVGERLFHIVEYSATHMVFKKLIQLDQTQPDRAPETFSAVFVSKLTEKNLNHLMGFNRGCFLLVLLLETQNQKVCKILKSKITETMKAFLQQQETTGSKILLKKLNEK